MKKILAFDSDDTIVVSKSPATERMAKLLAEAMQTYDVCIISGTTFNETIYPNYAYVAPISWSIKSHINDGRKHLNFSEWGNYNDDLKKSMLKNSAQSLKNYSMPMGAYISKHPEANLTKAERVLVTKYFESLMK